MSYDFFSGAPTDFSPSPRFNNSPAQQFLGSFRFPTETPVTPSREQVAPEKRLDQPKRRPVPHTQKQPVVGQQDINQSNSSIAPASTNERTSPSATNRRRIEDTGGGPGVSLFKALQTQHFVE